MDPYHLWGGGGGGGGGGVFRLSVSSQCRVNLNIFSCFLKTNSSRKGLALQNAYRTIELTDVGLPQPHCRAHTAYLAVMFISKVKCSRGSINTLRPRQNGRHFADNTFNRIFVNGNFRISIKCQLKFPKGPINNIPALVQIIETFCYT